MKDHVRAIIIGGGIVGCSILHHLTHMGWRDVLLLEKAELATGITRHSAASVHRFDLAPNLIRLRDQSIRLYAHLAEKASRPRYLRRTGGIILATDADRVFELEMRAGIGRQLGLPHVLLNPREIKDLFPLINLVDVKAGLYDPLCGWVDAHGLTRALAAEVDEGRGQIHHHTEVLAMSQQDDGSWLLVTEIGEISTDIVINAAGLWARDLAMMIGLDLPLVLMEHQYLVTMPIDAVAAIRGQLPMLIEPEASYLLREEQRGLLIEVHSNTAHPWALSGVPEDFGQDPLPEAPNRIASEIAKAATRVPCLKGARPRALINGPLCMTPDGRPLVGPVPGFANYFVAAGFMDGIGLAGGIGRALAEWIVEGQPPLDLFAIDVARFGSFAGRAFCVRRASDAYCRSYATAFPLLESPAGRPLRRTPIHDRLAAKGAQFRFIFGWEQPAWFGASRSERRWPKGFLRRGAWTDAIRRECGAARRDVAVVDLTTRFAKHMIEGPDASAALDRLLATPLPDLPGELVEAVMLDRQGRIAGIFRVNRVSDRCFYLAGDVVAGNVHRRWFERHLASSDVAYADVTARYAVLGLTGPAAWTLLDRITDDDVSNEALPKGMTLEAEIAGAPAQIGRLPFAGDRGYVIHAPMEYQGTIYDALDRAGQELGLADMGMLALESLYLEAGRGRFGKDYSADLTPFEAGIGSMVGLDKGAFIGRDMLLLPTARRPVRCRALVRVDAHDADAVGGEPVYYKGVLIGSVLSGGFGYATGMSLANVLLPHEHAAAGSTLSIDILGERRGAVVLEKPPIDVTADA